MRTSIFLLAVSVLWSMNARAGETVLIPAGSTWNYFIGTQEPSSPTNAWRTAGFDHSSWPSGPAPIGYSTADPKTGHEASIATAIEPMGPSNSVYFRKTFTLTD